jgi:hypothetical protein
VINIKTPNKINTNGTIILKNGLSNFKCIKYIKTSVVLIDAKISAANTVAGPNSMLVIKIDENVNVNKTIRITIYVL